MLFRNIFTLSLLITFNTLAFGQTKPPKAGVSISVFSEKNEPLEGANVFLLKNDTAVVRTGATDKAGAFIFENVPGGQYTLKITYTGYEPKSLKVGQPADAAGVTDAGSIRLKPSGKELKEVTVISARPYIERRLDKTVLNVSSSIVNTGSTALEILQKAPGVTLDPNDVLSLKGKQGVIVMMDGKPSPLSADALANLLRSLPSSAIDKIELITNPSAKYDAAGNAGIINIILKKDLRQGMNGTLTGTFGRGNFSRLAGGVNWNYRNKGVNLFGSYNHAERKQDFGFFSRRYFYRADTLTGSYDVRNMREFTVKTNLAKLGADLFLSKKTTLGLAGNVFGADNSSDAQNNSLVLDPADRQTSSFLTRNISRFHTPNFSLNANIKTALDSAGGEFTADADYARYISNSAQHFVTNYYNPTGSSIHPPYILSGRQESATSIRALKADFVRPYKSGYKLETGLKASYVTADNDLNFFDESSGTAIFDTTKSNHFIYNENINAAYINVSREFKRFNMQLGLRGEHTRSSGNQLAGNRQFTNSYFQLFPSFFFNYNEDKNNTSGLSLSRRIDRPTYADLNPFKIFLDPSTYVEGNPFLKPELTYAVEFSHTLHQKYSATFSYSVTTQKIVTVLFPQDIVNKVVRQTTVNLAAFKYYGLLLTLPFRPLSWWNSTNNISGYYSSYTGDLANTSLHNSLPTFNINSSNDLKISNVFSGEVNFFYQAREAYGFMTVSPKWQLSAGIQKQLFKNQATLKLNVQDIFNSANDRATSVYSNYTETFRVKRDSRAAVLSLTYRFGKKSVPPSRRRAMGADEEKKRAGGQ
jgi:hypothetical protein